MKDRHGRETVPCKWCGKQTPMTGTELCDRCWELEHRITADPVLAYRIFQELDLEAKALSELEES